MQDSAYVFMIPGSATEGRIGVATLFEFLNLNRRFREESIDEKLEVTCG